ncbi:MAG: L-alanine-DL-glutamate epimerase-like enolase superfamily enzyme [Verrucomicrobiales bacterium]|jgi:L-alanine-DL-glutamate epimerase-like enolase superfamily enzyme
MQLKLTEISLPLRHPFTTTHGTITTQQNLLVELSKDGIQGYGEGAASHAYKELTAEAMRVALESVRDLIEADSIDNERPSDLWQRMEPHLAHNRFALCALDQAAHDLWGKLHGAPVWQLWGHTLTDLPVSNYTIGIDSIDIMVAKMAEFEDWPIFKIKLGTDHDLDLVRQLRKHTSARFRIDANTAWTAEQAIAMAPELMTLGVDFLEQPLKADDWAGMAKVKADCVLPVIADESCQVEADVDRCAEVFDGINIKLTKAGGLTPARRMIQRARQLGIKVMAGCMTESTVGISAIAQLLPELDFVDMDGAALIADGGDIASGVHLHRGRPVFPTTNVNGNGVTLLA